MHRKYMDIQNNNNKLCHSYHSCHIVKKNQHNNQKINHKTITRNQLDNDHFNNYNKTKVRLFIQNNKIIGNEHK